MRRHRAHAIGIGYKYVGGRRTDKVAVVFYVHKKLTVEELIKRGIEAIPRELFGHPTDVREVPRGFTIRQDDTRYRPFSGIGYKEIGATATLGYVNRKGEVLSNNHVLANQSLTINVTASKGDAFIQPGYIGGGRYPEDVVGHLDRWIDLIPANAPNPCGLGSMVARFLSIFPKILGRRGRFVYIYEPQPNYIDGAVGIADPGTFEPGIRGLGEVVGGRDPILGRRLQKRGRTTGLTHGVVTAVGVSVDVEGYQGIYTCHFEDQVAIESETGAYSQPGDSGAANVTDEPNSPLYYEALLFAGGQDSTGKDITIATPYRYISSLLNYEVP
jgi:hypothetical protein